MLALYWFVIWSIKFGSTADTVPDARLIMLSGLSPFCCVWLAETFTSHRGSMLNPNPSE